MSTDAKDWIRMFPSEEIPFILALVRRCSGSLRKKRDWEREDTLSNRLRLLIRRDEKFRQSGMIIDREIHVFDEDSDSEVAIGRIDFRFLSTQRRFDADWHFVIEAKRLHVIFKKAGWKSLVSEYVIGHQGMMCFIDRRYARALVEGVMLGYVFDGKIEKARDAVVASIKTHSVKLKCFLFDSSDLGSDLSNVVNTRHALKQGLFTIYHLFVAV